MKTLTLLGCLIASPVLAQVEGGVSGPTKKALSSTKVTASDPDGKVVESVNPDERGFYQFKTLKPGKYKIDAEAAGFERWSQDGVEVRTAYQEPSRTNDISMHTRLEIRMKASPPGAPKTKKAKTQ